MNEDLDQILTGEELVRPSSRFIANVMLSVELEPSRRQTRRRWCLMGVALIGYILVDILLFRGYVVSVRSSVSLAYLAGVAPELGSVIAMIFLYFGVISLLRFRASA